MVTSKETLATLVFITRSLGWIGHSENVETGTFLAKDLSVRSVREQGKLMSDKYVPYDMLEGCLLEDECLVQIIEQDGQEVAFVMFEEWHNDPHQYDYHRLKGYYAMKGTLYQQVPEELYYAVLRGA